MLNPPTYFPAALVSNVLSQPDFTPHSVLLALLGPHLQAGAGVNAAPSGAGLNRLPFPWPTAMLATLPLRFTAAGAETETEPEPEPETETAQGNLIGAVACGLCGRKEL